MTKHLPRLVFILILLIAVAGVCSACASKHNPFASTGFDTITIDEKGKIVVNFTLKTKEAELHKGEVAKLYELLPGEGLEVISAKEPLATEKISTEMQFRFSLTDGGHSRLYSSFAVCFEDGTPISNAQCIVQNPELLAVKTPEFPWSKNQKGLCVTDADAAAAYGTAHAMIEAKLSSLFSGSDLSFSFGEKSYALSASYLDILDRQIQASYLAGMRVSLRLITDAPCDTPAFTALIDFLTERYSSPENGIVRAIFLDPTLLTAEQIELYATLSHIALLAHTGGGQIYVVAPVTTLENTKLFFADLGARIDAKADFEWGAAVIPSENGQVPWANTDTEAVCANTLQTLFNDLKGLENPPIRFAVCDLSYAADNPQEQAVSLAYGYAAAIRAGASTIFYRHQKNDDCGLLDATGTPRPALEMFCSLDATLTPAQASLCKATSPAAWELVSTLPCNRRALTGTGSHGLGSGNCITLFDFTTSNAYAFSATGGITLPTIQQSEAWNAPVLYTWMHAGKTETGVRKILDSASVLKNASMLSVQALAQYQNTRSCTMTLRLQGVDKKGQILIYEAPANVSAGSWQYVTFSIAPFVAEADLDKPCILSLLTEPSVPTDENFVFWIKAFYLYEPQPSIPLLLPVTLVLIGCGASFVIFYLLYRRSRRAYAQRSEQ